MKDSTVRQAAQAAHNATADSDREVMEKRWGKVWDTKELQLDFKVEGFLAPYIVVERIHDGVRGTLTFSHYPRWYYNFQEGA